MQPRPDQFNMASKPDYVVVTLYRPHLPKYDESWHIFEDDDSLLAFFKDEVPKYSKIINLKENRYPNRLAPLEDTFHQVMLPKHNFQRINFQRLLMKLSKSKLEQNLNQKFSIYPNLSQNMRRRSFSNYFMNFLMSLHGHIKT